MNCGFRRGYGGMDGQKADPIHEILSQYRSSGVSARFYAI